MGIKILHRPGLSPVPQELIDKHFTGYGIVVTDRSAGEPVAWGYNIRPGVIIGETMWAEIAAKYGTWVCLDPITRQWALVTKFLTLEEARIKYGDGVEIELGPRGGFRGMTVGKTRFAFELFNEDGKNGRPPGGRSTRPLKTIKVQ
ncbi:hypothetical protein [Oligoflexus tunisiensis]|uniref:hypothetical protein n=1 Tax=Oligoflexus tunisiensis TaxID=708132 RepID=UPI00114CA609|nr:hypothetical protein [Oligoflexus tunisiensis]